MALTKPDLTKPVFQAFPDMKAAVVDGLCPTCGLEIVEDDFQDELSEQEYSISGMCPVCQDEAFAPFGGPEQIDGSGSTGA